MSAQSIPIEFDPKGIPVLSETPRSSIPPRAAVAPGFSVMVKAPARLHMGFLDLGGSLGRKFGSIGMGINEIVTRLTLTRSDRLAAEGPGADRALAAAERFARALARPLPASIRILEAIPAHAGLGSGTQLALAVGAGLARLYGLDLGTREIAPLIERGARSGIGIAVFDGGGLVVDGGRGEHTVIPPVLSRLPFPEPWRFVIILDHGDRGLHGAAEIEAFRTLPVYPTGEAARLCHWVLMRGLPALAEGDLPNFGAVIAELQRSVGDHFAPAQGGRFASRDVAEALAYLESRGAVGIGQSSWGPTGFCLAGNPGQADTLLAAAREHFADRPGIEFLVGTARNRGAEITVEPADHN